MSLIVASAQLRAQPDTPRLDLVRRVERPPTRFSISTPRPIESPRPKRQKSEPTQVLTVRTAFAYAWPDGMPSSSQIFGRSSLRDAEQVEPLAAGDLDQRDLVLLGDVGDPAQLGRRGDAAVHARDDAERAVLLDVARGRGR